jgi:hypothetical protein
MQVCLPERLYFVRQNKQLFGTKTHSFGFLNKSHAIIVVQRLERNRNIDIWDTPLNPGIFWIRPAKHNNINNITLNTIQHETLTSDEYVKECALSDLSIRLINDVDKVDEANLKLYASLEIMQTTQTSDLEHIRRLENLFRY